MAERTTRKDVEAAFRRIMRAIGGDYNHDDVYSLMVDVDTGGEAGQAWRWVLGRYALDYAACYGGYRIERCANDAGGVRDITMRYPARQFCEAADFMGRILSDAAWYDREA